MEIKILGKEQFINLIPSYITLNNKVFNSKMSEDYYKWRYLNNPCGEILICAAIDDGKVVANYSASPIELINSEGKLIKTAQSLNTMTDPEYQGMGLFGKTANLLYDKMIESNYSFIWGFPNKLSHWVFNNKLNWKDIYEFPTLSLDLKHFNKKLEVNQESIVEVNLSNIDSLNFNQEILGGYYQINKKKDYLKWRYLENPLNKYFFYINSKSNSNENKDYIIFKLYDNKLNIVEFEAVEDESCRNLLNYAIQTAQKNDIDFVTIWATINTKKYSFIETYGFWLDLPIFHLGGRFFDGDNNIKWNISQGDDNIF